MSYLLKRTLFSVIAFVFAVAHVYALNVPSVISDNRKQDSFEWVRHLVANYVINIGAKIVKTF